MTTKTTAAPPVFTSPALPTELLRYIIHHCVYPTTLIVCSEKDEFLSLLALDIANPPIQDPAVGAASSETTTPELLTARLQQLSVARHIQTVFIPTVSHLRGYISVLPASGHKVARPPVRIPSEPRLLVYGFLGIHRDTSEWSAQAINNTASILVEAARDLDFQLVVIEPQGGGTSLETLLEEAMPVLPGAAKRNDAGEWVGRTVTVRRALSRWFQFKEVQWKR